MDNITMRVAKDGSGIVTWTPPRSTKPFVINLRACVGEVLFQTDVDSEVARTEEEDLEVTLQAGTYNVVGGQLITYLNIIEVGSDGNIVEKRGMMGDPAKTIQQIQEKALSN